MPGSSLHETNCKNMISALDLFVKKTEETCTDLAAAVGQCQQVLGEDEVIFEGLTKDENALLNRYMKAAGEAKKISAGIQKDLELIEKARRQALSEIDGE